MIKNKDLLECRSLCSAEGEIWTPDQGLMSPLDKDSGKSNGNHGKTMR